MCVDTEDWIFSIWILSIAFSRI